MSPIKLFLVFLFYLLLSNSLFGQYFNNGQDRSSIHWKHIRSTNFEVIFPEGFESQGEHVVKLLEKAYDFVPNSLDHKPKKISVILHTETVKSNAFLGWCPGRIEMYTTPNQGTYSQDWLEQLAIHEYRHMVQVGKLEDEMPQLIRFILGEHAAALLTGAHLPFWFLEGDAVAVETGLSESGRGRLPDFMREFKAQLVEKGKFNYDKAYLGSFKDNVSNHYPMGYLMVAGAREKYNKLVWDSVLNSIARHPFSFASFDKGLKKSTGLTASRLYDTIFDNLTAKWLKEDQVVNTTIKSLISPPKRYFTSYTNAVNLSDGSIFAQRTTLTDINRFVSLNSTGEEKIIFTPGYPFEESVTARNNLIVWSERLPDIRWDHADKSLLRIFNCNTRKLTEFKFNTKIFAPSLSPDSKTIITVEADNNYQFFLSEIDIQTGAIINRYKSDKNDYFITPSYVDEPGKVIVILMRGNKKGIAKIDLDNKTEQLILPLRNQEIKRPSAHEGYIYFIGGYRGTDDLYAIDTLSSKIYRVITSRFGISDYAFDDNSIIYSDYAANGFQTVKTSFDSISLQEINPDTIKNNLPFFDNLAKQEKQPIDFSQLDDVNYQPSPYSKPACLFKFHSWAPVSIDPYNYGVYPGVSFMSQNMLSTAETVLGYRYKWEEKKGEYYLNFKYMGWFPVIDVQADYGKSKSYYYLINQYLNQNNEVVKTDTVRKDYSWNETNVVAQLYLPFDFSKGKYYRALYPTVNYRYTYYKKDNRAPDNFPDGSVSSVEFALRYYSMLHQSQQDIYPEWGMLLDMGYMSSLNGVLNFGQYVYGAGSFYTPGLAENHGVKLYGGFQAKNQVDFSLTDRVRFPRGHQRIDNQSMISYGVDYKFPLAFPDLRLGRFLYIKKVNFGIFYDQAFLQHQAGEQLQLINLQSTGIEVTFNTNFLRFFAPVDIGFRSSYLFDRNVKTDFLFNISFTL
jgi:hypothetical protein